jgi:hypothetical protein
MFVAWGMQDVMHMGPVLIRGQSGCSLFLHIIL